MQKLSGISSGKNNKSCGTIHIESNKIGFAFFRFFHDFIHNLQETGKSLLLFELPFCREALGKKLFFAMSPLGAASGGPAAIPAGDRRIPAGGGWGSELGPTRVRFGGSIVGEELPEGGHAGGRRRWPLRLPVRRGGGSAGLENGSASYGRSRGGGERATLARGRPGNWSSPRLPGLGADGRHRTA
jgi:hypothetical protein